MSEHQLGRWARVAVGLLLAAATSTMAQAEQGLVATEGPVIHFGRHLNNPAPPYPQRSVACREQGTVALRVQVEANGRPSAVKVVQSSGYPRLDASAYRTVRNHYRFIPRSQDGVAISSVYTFSIQFVLPDGMEVGTKPTAQACAAE
ncbi:MAG: energy transducer TonB [Neisseriaceae bacterium]|nr:energy transducer TonB [Neisseriaceae bacterium]